MPEQRLGRRHAPDPRDGRFLLAQHPRALAVAKVVDKTWAFFSRPLNQGDTGTCVGHAWKHSLMAAPMVRLKTDAPSAFDIYDAAIKVDEWTDNDNDVTRQMGTSVRAGAKVLQGMGLLDEYAWATDIDTITRWLGGVDAAGKFVGGPVVIGVNWYDSMFETDPEGILHISGSVAGGHSVLLNRLDLKRGLAGGIQNWELPWGFEGRGHFLIPLDSLDRLVRLEDGEACTATESRKRFANG